VVVPERWPAAVIGGGVVGCAVLWELARHGVRAVLIEAEPDIGEGVSKANSAIVHTGFDARPGTLEARLLRRAADTWPAVIDRLGVPFLAVGALMLARTDGEVRRLRGEIQRNATNLGVRTELLGRGALRDVAPYVSDEVVGALAIPDEGVIDPFWLTRAYAEAAIEGGAEVRTGYAAVAMRATHERITVELADGTWLEVEQVFDCGGLHADDVARLMGDRSFAVAPRKGQFLVSEETYGVDRIVLPIPGPMGKGMLVTPIVFGGLLLGPTAVDQDDKADRSTDPAAWRQILDACSSLVPAVRNMLPIRSFAGLRTVSSTGDHVVKPSPVTDRLFLVAGMRSTGVSASPAIAELAVAEASKLRAWRRPAVARRLAPPPVENRPPGEVVCLCRSITRGEIEAACRRATSLRTLDAIKRRCGATFGDCQGNLCALEVAEVVARRVGEPVTRIEKGSRGSWLFRQDRHETRQRLASLVVARTETSGVAEADVVVIGGGLAGVGVALALREAGVEPLIVERHGHLLPRNWSRDTSTAIERARLEVLDASASEAPLVARTRETVSGLVPDGGGWILLAQSQTETAEIHARAVVIATGGYVEPREHRAIGGPRPAGIITADLVAAAAAVGVVPGERAVVVGAGRAARAAVEQLQDGGCKIVEHLPTSIVEEVRGGARLEGVRAAARWIDCDTLVFADRLVAAPFLLRGLGLIDGRPGTPAPVDADGQLPIPGLWAAGTCVVPDVDHRRSLEDGLRVGASVARSLITGRAR